MKFIIDGNGKVSYRAAYDLLKDIARPYTGKGAMFVTSMILGPLSEDVLRALKELDECNFVPWNQTTAVMNELQSSGEKIYIVLDPSTRKDNVAYCIANGVQVLDLEKGLYPVKEIQ